MTALFDVGGLAASVLFRALLSDGNPPYFAAAGGLVFAQGGTSTVDR